MIEEILKLDSDLFLYFNNLGNPYFDNFWMFLSKTEANVIVYLLVLIAYIYSINNKKRAKTLFRLIIAIAILITISDQTSNLFKDSFQRLRPCYNELISDSLRLLKESCGQLREMEKDSLINRKVYDVVPPKVEYSLTDFGWSFKPVLTELCKWKA